MLASAELSQHVGRLVQVQGIVATAWLPRRQRQPIQFVTLEDEYELAEVILLRSFTNFTQIVYIAVIHYSCGIHKITERKQEMNRLKPHEYR